MNKITALLPLAPKDFIRSRILLETLNTFEASWIDKIVIVIPPNNNYEIIKEYRHFTIEIIHENTLFSKDEFDIFKELKGWYKQQIIKLWFAKICTSDFYITFDADILLMKKLTLKDLIFDNKSIVKIENTKTHIKWWEDSAKIIQVENIPYQGMGITPEILITREVKNLIAYLDTQEPAILKLKENNWTEYTLYWLFLHKNNKTELYINSDNLYKNGVWSGTIINRKLIDSLTVNSGYFIIIQSIATSEYEAYTLSCTILGEWDIGAKLQKYSPFNKQWWKRIFFILLDIFKINKISGQK